MLVPFIFAPVAPTFLPYHYLLRITLPRIIYRKIRAWDAPQINRSELLAQSSSRRFHSNFTTILYSQHQSYSQSRYNNKLNKGRSKHKPALPPLHHHHPRRRAGKCRNRRLCRRRDSRVRRRIGRHAIISLETRTSVGAAMLVDSSTAVDISVGVVMVVVVVVAMPGTGKVPFRL
jgi:hypothetical protein